MESRNTPIQDHRLRCFGWTEERAQEFAEHESQGAFPGRILRQQHARFQVICREGEIEAGVRGKLRRQEAYPVVGDWVALSPDTPATGMIETARSFVDVDLFPYTYVP